MTILDRSIPPTVRELHGLSLPPVEQYTLSNGLQLYVLRSGSEPVSRILFTWRRGAIDDSEGPRPRLKIMGYMLNEGSQAHSGAEIAEALEFNGAWTSVAATGHKFGYQLFAVNDAMAEVLPLALESIYHPSFPADSLAAIRQGQAAACKFEQAKVPNRAKQLSRRLLYGADHPIAVETTPELILSIEREHLAVIHSRVIRRHLPMVFLAGQFDDAYLTSIIAQLEQLQADETLVGLDRRVIPAGYKTEGETAIETMPQAKQTAIQITIPTIPCNHPDYEALRFAIKALGGYFGSRLVKNIREEKGYTYGIHAGLASKSEVSGVTITCQTANQHVQLVLQEVEHEIRRMVEEPPRGDELLQLRRSVLTNFADILDSPFTMMDYHQGHILNPKRASYAQQLREIEALTPERIAQVMSSHILPAPRLTAMAGAITNF